MCETNGVLRDSYTKNYELLTQFPPGLSSCDPKSMTASFGVIMKVTISLLLFQKHISLSTGY